MFGMLTVGSLWSRPTKRNSLLALAVATLFGDDVVTYYDTVQGITTTAVSSVLQHWYCV